jgi:hypothetical protein
MDQRKLIFLNKYGTFPEDAYAVRLLQHLPGIDSPWFPGRQTAALPWTAAYHSALLNILLVERKSPNICF